MTESAGKQNERFEGQLVAAGLIATLVALIGVGSMLPGFRDGEFLGMSSPWWAVLMAANAIAHQYYVVFCWRSQLHGRALTKRFGEWAFVLYAVPFFILLAARPVLAVALGFANRGTLQVDPMAARVVAVMLCLPPLYLLYSIHRYFGFKRAAGIDHFIDNPTSLGIVHKGIYRFTSNAQYIYGFLLFWAVALWFQSMAALVMAAFVHAYIWVHYYCTEQPDMKRLYGEPTS